MLWNLEILIPLVKSCFWRRTASFRAGAPNRCTGI